MGVGVPLPLFICYVHFLNLRSFNSNEISCEFNMKFLKQVLNNFSCTCHEHGRKTCMEKYDLKKK